MRISDFSEFHFFENFRFFGISDFSEFLIFRNFRFFGNSASEASEPAGINSEAEISIFFSFFKIFLFFRKFLIFLSAAVLRGEMKIHLQTKRGLNTLKFWGCSEILTLILRGNWKSGA